MLKIKKVAVVGTGVIGIGWIIRFLAHNKIVYAYDKNLKQKKILIKLLVFKDAFIGTRFFIDYVNFIRKYSYKYYISYLVACNNHYGKN